MKTHSAVKNPQLILIVASIGLFLNIISALILGHGVHDILHPGHNHASPQTLSAQPVRSRIFSTSPNRSALPTAAVTPPLPLSYPIPMPNRRPHSLLSFALLLHILGDAANNVAVIVSSLIIWRVPNHIQGRFYADPAVTVLMALGIMVGAGWGSWKCGKGMLRLLRNRDCGVKDGEDALKGLGRV
jgi:solute carrier family 30 (zinc transporter), member 1